MPENAKVMLRRVCHNLTSEDISEVKDGEVVVYDFLTDGILSIFDDK